MTCGSDTCVRGQLKVPAGGQEKSPPQGSDFSSLRAGASFRDWTEEVGNSHWFIAMRARTSGPDATTEGGALWAPLVAQVTCFAGWALIDRHRSGSTVRDLDERRAMSS